MACKLSAECPPRWCFVIDTEQKFSLIFARLFVQYFHTSRLPIVPGEDSQQRAVNLPVSIFIVEALVKRFNSVSLLAELSLIYPL